MMMPEDVETPRESIDSSQSRESTRYRSRFHEHMSQAYTTYPTDWPFGRENPETSHIHSHSIMSMSSETSQSSSRSTFSIDKFKDILRRKLGLSRTPKPSYPTSEDDYRYRMKGSERTFRKEDIKLGGLKASTNLLEYV